MEKQYVVVTAPIVSPKPKKVKCLYFLLAPSELRKRPGNSDVDNASRDCFKVHLHTTINRADFVS